MKVVFTYYPLYVRYNHGTAILSAQCKAAGVESFTVPMDDKYFEIINRIKPDYVCYSAVTKHDYLCALDYLEKTTYPKIMGGVYARAGTKVSPMFKYVCRGEAETGFVEFLNGDMTIFDQATRAKDINTFPDYDYVIGNEFHRDFNILKNKKIFPYSSSRGCPYKCSFCQNINGKVRIKTTIKEDLDRVRKYSPDIILITDELAPYYSDAWLSQIEGNKTPLSMYIRADIPEDRLLFLIGNGLSVCAFGIESGDEFYRNSELNKGLSDEKIYKTVECLKKHDIDFIPFYMVGTPNETHQIQTKTFKMAQEIGGNWVIWEYEKLWEPQQQ